MLEYVCVMVSACRTSTLEAEAGVCHKLQKNKTKQSKQEDGDEEERAGWCQRRTMQGDS